MGKKDDRSAKDKHRVSTGLIPARHTDPLPPIVMERMQAAKPANWKPEPIKLSASGRKMVREAKKAEKANKPMPKTEAKPLAGGLKVVFPNGDVSYKGEKDFAELKRRVSK